MNDESISEVSEVYRSCLIKSLCQCCCWHVLLYRLFWFCFIMPICPARWRKTIGYVRDQKI